MGIEKRQAGCSPTWKGHIETTNDALLIFTACSQGVLQYCSRRPRDRERESLIISGNVFAYEEATSGIKRWSDGIPWSPSRVLTNFMLYRQLNPFLQGEKKRAIKGIKRLAQPSKPTPTSASNTPTANDHTPFPPQLRNGTSAEKYDQSLGKIFNYKLVGSLVDSYDFKVGGLVKKTIKVTIRDCHLHLVSYYSVENAKNSLKTPRDDLRLKDITISDELLSLKFKYSNLDDAGEGEAHYKIHSYSTTMGYTHTAAYAPSYAPGAGYAPSYPPVVGNAPSYPPGAGYAPSYPPIVGNDILPSN